MKRRAHALPPAQRETIGDQVREGLIERDVEDDVGDHPARPLDLANLGAGEPIVLSPRQLEVVPGHALELLAGIPQQERRVEGGHEHAAPVRVGLPTQARNALLRADQGLSREVAEGQDHVGADRVDLGDQEWAAGQDFVRLRIAIALRPALDHVGDIAVALAVEAHRGEHAGQQLARAADEGQPLLVLFLARAFAHHHQPGAGTARAERDIRAALAELAERAALTRLLLPAQGVRRIREGHRGEREVAQPQIAVVPEGVGQPMQGFRHGLARVAHPPARGAARVSLRSPARRPSTRSRMASATSSLLMRGRSVTPPHRSSWVTWLSSASKPMPLTLTSLATRRSTPFAWSLAAALARTSLVSAAKL